MQEREMEVVGIGIKSILLVAIVKRIEVVSGGWGGPKLNYDGRTSGIGRDLGGVIGDAAGGAIGSRFGGSKGGLAGGYLGGKIGERAGDAWKRRANRGTHDRWNSRGSKGHSWRMSKDEEISYEKLW